MRQSSRLMVEKLTGFAASGFTIMETAEILQSTYASVGAYSRRYEIKFIRQGLACPSERSERMANLYKAGKTLEQIGAEFGITRERVRQIIKKHHGLTAKHGGATKIAKDKRKKFYADRDARSMKKWGCPFSQYILLRDAGKPVRAYHCQRQNAAARGIGWELNLWQWWTIWQDSGRWNERGRGRGYNMCRKLDQGPYSVDNVYIATATENIKDYWLCVKEGVRGRVVHGAARYPRTPREAAEAKERTKAAMRAASLRYQKTPKGQLRYQLRKQGLPKEQRDAIVAAQFGVAA